jgi:hydroxymethylglutaryl-CoA lyase
LQNEPVPVSVASRIALIEGLVDAGVKTVETGSFVSPKWVPQMADTAAVLAGLKRKAGVRYPVLVPNLQGLEAAEAAGAKDISIFAAASESFSKKNINCSIAESLDRFGVVTDSARRDGTPVRGYVSCVTDCPYEGRIAPEAVAEVVRELFALGCREVSLGDTIGHGTPDTVAAMLRAVLEVAPPERLAGHFHDTRGRALENVTVALERGLRVFDAACGGLGGCPFAPGAAGNVATEALAEHLSGLGFATGLDPGRLLEAAGYARSLRAPA